jgi:acetylornithine deacetylase/succinyl-diaminopimelate desuccinylase family protein
MMWTDMQRAVLNNIERDDTVEFLRDLIRTPSVNPPGDEEAVAQLVHHRLETEGIDVRLQDVEPGRPNVIGRLTGSGDGPVLLFNAHMDTVPAGDLDSWSVDPFAAEMRQGKILGRGAVDDKGGLCGMVMAAVALKRAKVPMAGELLLTFVMGEEAGHVGTHHLVDSGLAADMAIVGEWSSARRIALGYRGRIELELVTHGITAHGSRPSYGINAIDLMTEIALPALKDFKMDYDDNEFFMVRKPTMNVGIIQGGSKVNMVPDRCLALVDIRLMPGQDGVTVCGQIEQRMEGLRREHEDLEIDVDTRVTGHAFFTHPRERLVQELSTAILSATGVEPQYFGKTGSSDANILHHEAGIPVVAYGPGNPSPHAPDEYVEIEDLMEATQVYALTALSVCGQEA